MISGAKQVADPGQQGESGLFLGQSPVTHLAIAKADFETRNMCSTLAHRLAM